MTRRKISEESSLARYRVAILALARSPPSSSDIVRRRMRTESSTKFTISPLSLKRCFEIIQFLYAFLWQQQLFLLTETVLSPVVAPALAPEYAPATSRLFHDRV
ncbi:hypothetical protein GYMLUDRAFT_241576 [Collybiopsis luxurians FD-317 M1]|uniref:Uncharacterized protein n=1 Tax=Collybiopsis luxurians FD-317 M1 TaxID=944289 RepID=A0A0D0BI14_9AGAR|nr:hypothetical protein GYMLUDRAFT_241576 [Collybiopsis luxurians FD-317 M1]